MSTLPPIISTSCAVLGSLAFVLGAVTRLSSTVTPDYHEEQRKKTEESQGIIYRTLGISPDAANKLIGVSNLCLVAGLLYPGTRSPTAGVALLYMCLGVRGRYITGRSIVPPLVTMLILAGAML